MVPLGCYNVMSIKQLLILASVLTSGSCNTQMKHSELLMPSHRPLFQMASPAACVASALLCGALSAPGAAAAAAGGGTAGKGPQKGKMPGGKPGNIPGATGEKRVKHVKGCRRVFTGVSFTR